MNGKKEEVKTAKKRYELLETYKLEREKWEKNKDGRPPRGPNPNAYSDPAQKAQLGGMFNGMILPIAKLSIKKELFSIKAKIIHSQ